MKPIVTKGTNAFYGSEGYEKLPAQAYDEKDIGSQCIQTVWELSDEELEVVKLTKRIYVSVVAENPQPICLDVVPFAEQEIALERYDINLIAIAISKTMKCDVCPYPCKVKENSSLYNCESHWQRILKLIEYSKIEQKT